jgi:hypothetical protein
MDYDIGFKRTGSEITWYERVNRVYNEDTWKAISKNTEGEYLNIQGAEDTKYSKMK